MVLARAPGRLPHQAPVIISPPLDLASSAAAHGLTGDDRAEIGLTAGLRDEEHDSVGVAASELDADSVRSNSRISSKAGGSYDAEDFSHAEKTSTPEEEEKIESHHSREKSN